jgi:dTDP-4-dehydrorhamnose 3,5-epimerase
VPAVEVRELAIPGALELQPREHADERGILFEYYRASVLADAAGRALEPAQANCSVSRRGTLRGIHFADVPPGQAKYVTCVRGAVLDVVVDVRVGSPTFGRSDSVVLDDRDHRCVFLPVGLGHAFVALTDDATVVYLCSTSYDPARERRVDPFDERLAIGWPRDVPLLLSEKDAGAPSLAQMLREDRLPSYEACLQAAGQVSTPPGS